MISSVEFLTSQTALRRSNSQVFTYISQNLEHMLRSRFFLNIKKSQCLKIGKTIVPIFNYFSHPKMVIVLSTRTVFLQRANTVEFPTFFSSVTMMKINASKQQVFYSALSTSNISNCVSKIQKKSKFAVIFSSFY